MLAKKGRLRAARIQLVVKSEVMTDGETTLFWVGGLMRLTRLANGYLIARNRDLLLLGVTCRFKNTLGNLIVGPLE